MLDLLQEKNKKTKQNKPTHYISDEHEEFKAPELHGGPLCLYNKNCSRESVCRSEVQRTAL